MDADALVMAAAVTTARRSGIGQGEKKHDGEMNIALERTDDILAWVGAHTTGNAVCLRLLDGGAGSSRTPPPS